MYFFHVGGAFSFCDEAAGEECEFFFLEGVLSGRVDSIFEGVAVSKLLDAVTLEVDRSGEVECVGGHPVGVGSHALICLKVHLLIIYSLFLPGYA